MDQTNWAGNYTYNAARLHTPETVEQVQELVTRCRKVKVLGTRHSFNSIADTTEDMISLARFNQVGMLDRAHSTITVGAGIRYGTLCQHLDREGYALHNLASLPHISVGGACATATHGSGNRNGNLATVVAALELVTADGKVIALSRESDSETFAGAVVGLGGLGIVTGLTLDIVPAFAMRQDVYENLPLAQVEAHFEEITGSAYSVSLFTDWKSARFNQAWLKSRVPTNSAPVATDVTVDAARVSEGLAFTSEPEWFGATLAVRPHHPIPGISAENCTEQMGIVGRWQERLPHFRMDYMPSAGDELQTEYLVPRRHACAALRAVYDLRAHIAPLLQISEIRTIAADTLWMSPSYGQDCVAIHFTWVNDWAAVEQLLPRIEAQLAPFEARPHWGKLFTTSAARLHSLYSKLPDFQNLMRAYDPQGKFRNTFLDAALFGEH